MIEYRLRRSWEHRRGGQHAGSWPVDVVASDPATGCCFVVGSARSQHQARVEAGRRLGDLVAFIALARNKRGVDGVIDA